MTGNQNICVICAWRETCQKKFSVSGKDAITVATSYEDVVDYLILDTITPDVVGIGASGLTHDWAISREIVQTIRKPVILAGGLSPENVGEAIQAVNPWGVDSLTHTNNFYSDGGFCKDLSKIERFVNAANRNETE